MLSKIYETAPVALARKLKDTVNAIIDELAARRLVAGHGIAINRYASGTTISATAIGAGAPTSRSAFIVDVYNDTPTEIPALSPVSLNTTSIPARGDQLPAWNVFAAVNDQYPWGIATGTIPARGRGRAAIQGIIPATTARIANTPVAIGVGDPVVPSEDGLIAGGTGGATLVAAPKRDAASGQWSPAVILLGQWPPPYRGFFRVRCVSVTRSVFRIEDGGNPSSSICGFVNFPTFSNIPRTDVTVRFGGAVRLHLFLVISWARDAAGNPVYSAAFQTTTGGIPSGDCFAFEVAQIYPSGKVIQVPYYATIDLPGWVL